MYLVRRLLLWTIYCLLPLVSLSSINAQTNDLQLSKEEIFELSFEEIIKLKDSLDWDENSSYLKKIYDIHIAKSKLSNDTIKLAKIYLWRMWIEESDNAIKYIDSAIYLTRNMTSGNFPGDAYYTKGALLYLNNQPESSLKELIKAYDIAQITGNHELIVDCFNAISGLKREYGQEGEALILQQESFAYLKRYRDKIDNYNLTYLITLDNLARSFTQIMELDSAKFYSKVGMEMSLIQNDIETFQNLSILHAQCNFYDGNFLKARDTLLKYVDKFDGTTKADILYYLGIIEGELGNSINKRTYLEQFDKILFANDLPLVDNVKETYQYLYKDAVEIDDERLQEKYLNRLFYYDSLLDITEQNIRNVTLMEFDLPMEEMKVSGYEKNLTKRRTIVNLFYGISVFLFALIILLYFRFKNARRKLKKLMEEKVEPIKLSPNRTPSNKIFIDQEIINSTLDKLEKWEAEEGFLNQEVSQTSLAKEMDTNSSYLSKIINTYKKQNFSNYIKDLRITYAINYIKEKPEVINNKSTIQIAEYFGFNSLDVFVRTLKNKTGVTPATFFKQIKKGNL
ncbi:helix-turn-helix domain-containing protein [Eudoraea sp.]|uniref:helix-turn-helix domain-containing protein n=5 Tax=Eudoraea sp. TaxID=1979955 RepID=UPI003C7758C7